MWIKFINELGIAESISQHSKGKEEMKRSKLLVLLIVFSMLMSACAQTTATPDVKPAPESASAPAKTEAPSAPAAPAELEKTEAPKAEEPETKGKPVVIVSPNDMTSLDPHEVQAMFPNRSLSFWVFDVLVRTDHEGNFIPELAKEWKQIDPLTREFKLVENATFQNGEPVNAEAVKYSFDRMQQEEFKSYNQIFSRTYLKEVNVVDEFTVQMITEKPAHEFEFLYWLSESIIVPPKYYSENDKAFLAENPVGSGPFKFVEWVKDDHITYVANEEYWAGPSDIKEIIFRVIPESSSRLNELITGNVDLVTGLKADQAAQANSDVSQMVPVESWRKMHVGMIQYGPEPLKNKLVRQALNYAVDKQTIIDSVLLGATSPLQAMVNSPLNNPDLEPYPYDPEKAKALLAEAGYPDGFAIKFQTPIERYGMDKEISQIVAQYLEEVGITVEFEAIEWGTYTEILNKRSLEGVYFMGYSTYIVPGPQLGTLTCDARDNPGGYCNEEYDQLFEQFNTSQDPAEVTEISNQMQAILWEDAPWIFLWRLPLFMGVSNRLQWDAHPALIVDAGEMSLKE